MPVKMRLHRVGKRHQPSYRIVITPALTPRDGSYLDQVGFYNPRTDPATIRIHSEKVSAWLRKGVEPTDRVLRLLATASIDPAAVRRGEPIPTPAAPPPKRSTRTKKSAPPDGPEPMVAPVAQTQEPGEFETTALVMADADTAPESAVVEPVVKPVRKPRAKKEVETPGEPPKDLEASVATPPDGEDAPSAEAAPEGEEKPARKRAARKAPAGAQSE